MPNVFLSYVDGLLKESRREHKLSWLGMYTPSQSDEALELKSYSGQTHHQSRLPLDDPSITSLFDAKAPQLSHKGHWLHVPVFYAGNSVGLFLAEIANQTFDETLQNKISSLASQLGALFSQPVSEYAILLDEKVAQLKASQPHYDWCGVYKLVGQELHLASFRGAPTPHEVIPLGHGICGAAVTENKVLNIPDVSKDSRYLSCDARTRSEIVVPIHSNDGKPIGEIDIDSHSPSAFDSDQEKKLQQLAKDLSPLVTNLI